MLRQLRQPERPSITCYWREHSIIPGMDSTRTFLRRAVEVPCGSWQRTMERNATFAQLQPPHVSSPCPAVDRSRSPAPWCSAFVVKQMNAAIHNLAAFCARPVLLLLNCRHRDVAELLRFRQTKCRPNRKTQRNAVLLPAGRLICASALCLQRCAHSLTRTLSLLARPLTPNHSITQSLPLNPAYGAC